MPETHVVLITGAAGVWGNRLAACLSAEPGLRVLGVDRNRLPLPIPGLDFVQVDIRHGAVAELLRTEGVRTVCHLDWVDTVRPGQDAFDRNVHGTGILLEACSEAGVGKFVWMSSMAVYGARATNPAFLTEEAPLRASRDWGTLRDQLEVEAVCNGFRLRAPHMLLTVLRFAHIVGPTADTPLTRFLEKPWRPSLLGFDPRLQVIHEEDVVAALAWAVLHDASGIFNVAAEGVLTLNRARGLAGKVPVVAGYRLAYWAAGVLGETGLRLAHLSPAELDYLRYSCVGDLARMRRELAFAPRHTAAGSLREFGEQRAPRALMPGALRRARAEARLNDVLAERGRAREEGQND
jgi:UDP-glucose 4-epimerase